MWMRAASKAGGSEHCECVPLCTDDASITSKNGEKVLRDEIGKCFELKEESIGPPKICLRGHAQKVEMENGVNTWSFGSSQHVQLAVKNVQEHTGKRGWKLPSRHDTPLSGSHQPELDVLPKLDPMDAPHCQSLIGVPGWMVEPGRVDTCLEVSMMSSHLELPREGHLQQLLHIFAF